MTKADKYFKEAASIIRPKELSEERTNKLLSKLINCIPNNGLLFKYKNISVNDIEFKKIFEPLEGGYLYLPSPDQMNDDIDTTFVYKTLHNENEIYQYHYDNRYKIHYYILKSKTNTSKDRLFVLRGLADGKSNYEIAFELNKSGRKASAKLAFVNKVKKEIDDLYSDKSNLEIFIDSYNNLTFNLRHDLHIYCFTESYKQDSMWAYYGGHNTGLCIVYDFKKALEANLKAKHLLISMGKVRYSDEKREIDILDIYDYIYASEVSNKRFKSLSYKLSKALFTKRKSWKHEKEWRLLQNLGDNIIHADLVKGLIIDKKISESEYAKKLIALASDRDWFVKTRQLNTDTMEYEYKLMKLK